MIEVVLLLWALMAGIASFVYVLNEGRLVEGKWDGTISILEIMLVLFCLPVILISACLWSAIWSVCKLYQKSGLGRIMSRKFKIGR